ncbi:MAG: serine/threonine protein kinase [Planctomycetes bacterium]|nr:serine/threonine protein kinase [Planctomycetota bacterium]
MTTPPPTASPTGTPGDEFEFERVRELCERARELPESGREAFVRKEAGDDVGLAEQVLSLLTHDRLPTPRVEIPGDELGADARSDHGERVQSTATRELMGRLEQAPKLDLDRYELEGEVDRGGMGAVIRIMDRHLNRRLAMKVMLERGEPRDEEERQLAHQLLGRFLEEAQVTSQLDHPGVVPVHELGLDQNGKVYFTMRLVKGRTAHEVFRESHEGAEAWPLTRALEVVLRVCDTMGYAHDKGVLHRDLKPANVMVGRFGEVYVMDWGLAKVLGQEDRCDLRIRPELPARTLPADSARRHDADSDEFASVVSMDGQKLGTPSYMPPEQARSEAVDRRADVYAIGAMLYELWTGRAPYTVPGMRVNGYKILMEVADGPPKRIEQIQKGVPAELVAIVDKAMTRDREHRYADTLALAADLRAFLAQRAVSAYRTGALVEMPAPADDAAALRHGRADDQRHTALVARRAA